MFPRGFTPGYPPECPVGIDHFKPHCDRHPHDDHTHTRNNPPHRTAPMWDGRR